ncbi:MFS transporter [Pontibacillus litoralis]|uniref:MFS transporter n=1 Tax=Pontibacillus litoralis TaxID=516703 RepID=UPI0018DD609A|nr:MFS transporter [Pontibacillus litoralis]
MHNATHNSTEINDQHKRKIVYLVGLLLTLTVINGTMFNVAVPDISATFELSPSEVSWVMTVYILIFSIGSLVYGKLADIYPIRTLLIISVVLFSTGAILGMVSPNYSMLIVARIIQAMGGAAIPALGFLIPGRFIPRERGVIVGGLSAVFAFASGVGPMLGGVVATSLGWRYLFVLSVLSLLTIPFIYKWIPQENRREGQLDVIGAILMAISVASLLFFITTFSWYTAATFVVVGLLFVGRVYTASNPFIDPSVLENVPYSTTVLVGFFANAVIMGLMFVLPIMLGKYYEFNAFQIGLVIFPGAMASAISGKIGGKITSKKGGIPVMIMGLVLMGTGTFLLGSLIGEPGWVVAACLLISYLSFPLISTAAVDLIATILPPQQNGVGIGLFNLLNFLAGTISTAAIGSVLDFRNIQDSWNPLFTRQGEEVIYSNIFIALTLIVILALLVFILIYVVKREESG